MADLPLTTDRRADLEAMRQLVAELAPSLGKPGLGTYSLGYELDDFELHLFRNPEGWTGEVYVVDDQERAQLLDTRPLVSHSDLAAQIIQVLVGGTSPSEEVHRG